MTELAYLRNRTDTYQMCLWYHYLYHIEGISFELSAQ